jgi:branched-chain amino acid transport system substrate-binding protein
VGVTKTSITVSVVAGFSGTLAPLVNKAYEAMLTWQEDVNAAGGINGRKVVLKQVDHKETAAGGVAACKDVQSNGSFIAAVPEGVEANVTAVDCLDAAGIPTVYYAAAANPKWKRAFADVITSAQGGQIMGSWVRNGLHGAGKKVGVLYVNQAAYKEVSDTFVPEAKRLGLDVASVQAVEPNQASFSSQLLKMKQAGVLILVISATTEAIGIVRDARSVGFQGAITGWGFLFDFVTAAAHDLFDGVTGLRPYATVDTPAYKTYADHMKARGRPRDDRTTDLEGFVTYGRALLYGEMLRRAGTNPTRESFVKAAETITGFETGIIPPISYSPANHIGSAAAYGVVCCNDDYTWKSQGPPRGAF